MIMQQPLALDAFARSPMAVPPGYRVVTTDSHFETSHWDSAVIKLDLPTPSVPSSVIKCPLGAIVTIVNQPVSLSLTV